MKEKKEKKEKKERLPIEGTFAIIFTIILIVLLTMQVIFRFFFGRSIAWAEEVSRYSFVWGVYCYIILAAKDDKHIRVTFQLKLFPEVVQKILLTLSDSLWIVFNVIVSVVSIKYVYSMFRYPYYSQTLGINIVWIYAIVPIGFIFLTVRVTISMIHRLKEHIKIVDIRAEM